MKKLYMGIFSALLMMVVIISTFQDLSAQLPPEDDNPGQPCDPDALPGQPDACPIDADVVYLLVGGIGLYFFARRKQDAIDVA